jgi:Gas vesicle synthesis protein GvpL/GvpF
MAGESPTIARPDAATAVYVYGVIDRASRPSGGEGVTGAPVRTIEGGDAAALVSSVPADWRAAGRADVEAHDRVLTALAGRGAVVPMRFGTLMASEEEVRERLLERHADELTSLLARLDGRVQMSVKAFYVDEALLREALARRPELKRRSRALEGLPVAASQDRRIALGRDVAAAVEEQRALDEALLVERLAGVAEDIQLAPLTSERQALAAHVLVSREQRPQLDAAVRELTTAHGDRFTVRYVGPLPPYSFCDLSLDTES